MAFSTPRDSNRVPAIFGVSSVDLRTPTAIKVNPATGALLIDGASLASADYTPATKIIAPTGYAHLADYYTTGTNDDVTIQLAIAAVQAAGGGKIQLKAGTYNITSNILFDNCSKIIFEGEGKKNTVINVLSDSVTGAFHFASSSFITIRSLEINGNKGNGYTSVYLTAGSGTVTDCQIEDVYLHDSPNYTISLIGSSIAHIRILNSDIENSNSGIYCEDTTEVAVRNCHFDTNTVIDLFFKYIAGGGKNNSAVGCTSTSSTTSWHLRGSIDNTIFSSNSVENNTNIGNGGGGIAIERTGIIANNRCLNNAGDDAIAVATPTALNVVVANNYISGDSTHNGIFVGDGSVGVTVIGNTITGCAIGGIRLWGAKGTSVVGNSLYNNSTNTGGNTNYSEIWMGTSTYNSGNYPAQYNTITGNTIITTLSPYCINMHNGGTGNILGTNIMFGATSSLINDSYITSISDFIFDDQATTRNINMKTMTTAGAGNNLVIQAGQGLGSGSSRQGGTLSLKAGNSIASGFSIISLFAAGTGSAINTTAERMRIFGQGGGRVVIGTSFNEATDGLTFAGSSSNYTLQTGRNTTTNTAGQTLTVNSGGSTLLATNKSGGDLILQGGVSTGSGTSKITFKTASINSGATGTLASIAINAEGSSYAAGNVLTLSGGGANSTITVNTVAVAGQLSGVVLTNAMTINAPGSGYTINDVVTLAGGTGGTATVNLVDSAGGILTATLTTGGSGYSAVASAAVTGGTGTGATFTTTIHNTGGILTATLTAIGTGYSLTTGNAVTGGAGTGATFDIVPFDNTDNTPTTKMTIAGDGTITLTNTMTINQTDTTNNPKGIVINNTGTGVSFDIEALNQATLSGSGNMTIFTTDTMAIDKGGMISLGGYSTTQSVQTVFASIAGRKENSTGANTRGYLQIVSTGAEVARFTSHASLLLGTTTETANNSINMSGQAATSILMVRDTTAATAGQTLTIQAGGAKLAGTDLAGGNLILQPGIPTGLGRTQVQIKGYTVATATGTSDNTALDRMIIGGFKALTKSSAIALVNCTLASNTVVGGIIRYAIEVFDGTDLQMETGELMYQCANKGGAFSGNTITQIGSAKQFLGSGTLATTFAISAANPAVISCNSVPTLTPSAGYPRITYTVENFTQQSISIQ